MTTWNYFDTQTFQASVGGLAISVGVGLLGVYDTLELPKKSVRIP